MWGNWQLHTVGVTAYEAHSVRLAARESVLPPRPIQPRLQQNTQEFSVGRSWEESISLYAAPDWIIYTAEERE